MMSALLLACLLGAYEVLKAVDAHKPFTCRKHLHEQAAWLLMTYMVARPCSEQANIQW